MSTIQTKFHLNPLIRCKHPPREGRGAGPQGGLGVNLNFWQRQSIYTWLGRTHAKFNRNRLIRYKCSPLGGSGGGRVRGEILISDNSYQFPHNKAPFVSNFIKIGQLFRTPPPPGGQLYAILGGGRGPGGLTPKIWIIDLDIIFPHIWNRIQNFSIFLELFAFVHFGSASDKIPTPSPGGGNGGEIWISDNSNPFPHE